MDDNPFWGFSIDRYHRKGVAPALLALQERAGADVNLILFAFWLGSRNELVRGEGEGQQIAGIVREWHSRVVRPLRAVRRDMKDWGPPEPPECGALREQVKKIEIDAEKVEHAMLFRAYAEMHPAWVAKSENYPNEIMAVNARSIQPPLGGEADDAVQEVARLCL